MNDKIFENNNLEIREINNSKDNEIRFDTDQLKSSKFKSMLCYYDSISLSPLEYLLTSLLACLSGAVGKNVYLGITKSLKIYLNIWAVIIGRSTVMRKTTAINLVKEDLQRIENKNFNSYKAQLEIYKNKSEELKEAKLTNDLVKPVRKYILFPQDSTIESLSEVLSISDKGLLTHSEFGSFLLQLNRGYSADAKQFLTNIFDIPESYEVSRVTKQNTMLQQPYLSILGASTIDWIQDNSTDTDLRSGFFARFIYSIRNIPDKEYIPLLKLKHLTKQSENYTYTRDIFDFLTNLDSIHELEITNKASQLYTDYDITSYKELLDSEHDNELSFKARLLIYCLKFAGLIALCEKRFLINENDILDAIQLTEYYKRNAERLLNDELTQDDFTRKEQKVIDVLKKKGGSAIRSDIMNATKLKAKELDEIEKNLIQKELIEIKREKHPYNQKWINTYNLISR